MNNTFIIADSSGVIDDLDCSSDSTMANIGHWIAPNGVDLTNNTLDPFDIIVGQEDDPGTLLVQLRNGHIITKSFEGVYTCIMPSEDGTQAYHQVGIYQNGFNGKRKKKNMVMWTYFFLLFGSSTIHCTLDNEFKCQFSIYT